jgi:flavin-dependent dehydrogenase
VIDQARFPRDKVCAGWVTPGVFSLLDLDPAEYATTGRTLQPLTGFRTSVFGQRAIETTYPRVISYAIRRCEFDEYLLRRSGAQILEQTPLTSLERRDGCWIVNGSISTRVVIGAGGHFCPVARSITTQSPHSVVVAKEAEFPLDDAGDTTTPGEVPELFFCRDLEGYGWCVRKGNYLNIGLGRRDHGDLNSHVDDFVSFLERRGLAKRARSVKWRGHAYLASGAGQRPIIADGVLLAGDAAGLAYPESGEGIKPAVESGRLAAEVLLAAGGRTDAEALRPYEHEIRRRYPAAQQTASPALQGVYRALGRRLLRSASFTRRVVINRWFLRAVS